VGGDDGVYRRGTTAWRIRAASPRPIRVVPRAGDDLVESPEALIRLGGEFAHHVVEQQRDPNRANDASQLRLGAGNLGYRGARGAAADREAMEEAGGEIGRAKPNRFITGVDA
jgi:hypothetical protein